MSASPDTNPALAEALMGAPEQQTLKDHIDEVITTLAKAMEQDTTEWRGQHYKRNNYTVAALIAYDPEIRRLVQRAGVNLRQFDDAVFVAIDAILAETSRRNAVGEKVIKTIKDLYTNGMYR